MSFKNASQNLTLRTDTEAELNLVKKLAVDAGATDAVICNNWAKGGPGAVQIAEAVVAATNQPSDFRYKMQCT